MGTPSTPPAAARQALAQYTVGSGRNQYHLIPYIGNKSGFVDIFRRLMPPGVGNKRIVDVFGGSGAFAIYCCFEFGSDRITYNDNNPVITNFMTHVRDDPDGLIREYKTHRRMSSPEYFLKVRSQTIEKGLKDAGRFLYLAKNAFSGKIRFNGSNKFNAPMRKGAPCPVINEDKIRKISANIQNMQILNEPFEYFEGAGDAFLYLDPPYMNNPNAHYNGVPSTADFIGFVKKITPKNFVMISEQNDPDEIGLPPAYRVYEVMLRRSLQYITRRDSREIVAINYEPADTTTE